MSYDTLSSPAVTTSNSDPKLPLNCPSCGQPLESNITSDKGPHTQKLQQRIAALEAENATLIASANAFADLADRLNRRLREETSGGV